jgi:rhomboid protease GluP
LIDLFLDNQDAVMESTERPSGAIALWGIIGINAAVYLCMVVQLGSISFKAKQAVAWGAIYAPLVSRGEAWRLLTANYIHFDLRHIAFNMIALFSWGAIVAARLGFLRFVLFYTLSGLAGSLASVQLHPSTVCAGASGAISGVLGALVALYFSGDKSLSGEGILKAVLYSAVYSFLMPSIDWQAHAGGFVAGVILGFFALLTLPKQVWSAEDPLQNPPAD